MKVRRFGVVLLIVATAVVALGCASDNTTPPPADASEQQAGPYAARTDDGVDVVYFETSKPCDCMAEVGDAVELAIDNNFSDELQSGELRFFLVVSDDPQNGSMLKDFDAQPFDLMIVSYDGGRGTIQPVYEIWNLMGDNEAIEEYVRAAVETSLRG